MIAATSVEDLAINTMSDKKITPQVVKKIESALEERKTKRDRRGSAAAEAKKELPAGADRRAGRDRRDLRDQ